MPDKIVLRRQLNKMLDELKVEFEATDDAARRSEIEELAARINSVLDRDALGSVIALAEEVAVIRQLIDGGTSPAVIDFDAEAAALQADINAILANSAEEDFALAPVPKEEPIVPQDITAPTPELATTGALELTEAHLIGLWKRSQFPLPTSGMVVFGLRGCRPVDYGGTPVAGKHAIEMREVNYRTMNCCIGQWRANQGFALFPGSTVPFHRIVESGVSKGGQGVNQLGRGRYKRYAVGWHKRSEKQNGHWALRQECAITLQRTKDDPDYEKDDPWFATTGAGDNIHCAFGMGPEAEIPEADFSSAGCQTVAGLVTKGVADSERGPWKKFIAPFKRVLSQEFSETEYVLFDAIEAQQMIVNQCTGKTVILRFGSQGPLVRRLQAGLKANGFDIGVDGDFGPGTFRAVRDWQLQNLDGVDGIVGPSTASALGFELPEFDFADAISGGPGYQPDQVSGAGQRRPIAWGQDTSGDQFNQAVVDMCTRLNVDPDHMMAVMAFETGEKFSPTVKNKAGSGATGLIQFMPATAEDLGTTIEHLESLSDVEQLTWVEKFFRRVAGGKNLASLSDVYMAVLYPKAIGKSESFALFTKGVDEPAYTQNKGLDADGTGSVTKVEAATKVQQKLRTGLKANHIG